MLGDNKNKDKPYNPNILPPTPPKTDCICFKCKRYPCMCFGIGLKDCDPLSLEPTNIGWICPRCNRVNAPSITQCFCSTELLNNSGE